MHKNEEILHKLFYSLASGDYRGIQTCLHRNIEFNDVGFDLTGKQVFAMWHMTCQKGIRVMFRNVEADDHLGSVYWECDYQFCRSENSAPRPIHNRIHSEFAFEDGLIRKQRDSYDYTTWTYRALGAFSPILGMFGSLIGNKEMLRKKVWSVAKMRIDEFVATHPEYA